MPTSDPVVCCVMLASGREEMVARAVRCFQTQTYRNKRLLVLDNGRPWLKAVYPPPPIPENGVYVTCDPASIGVLRNRANKHATHLTGADIIAHWDSDDWSHPNRIAEQVALLQSSGAECVGYNEMLFWKTERGDPREVIECQCGNRYDRMMATVCPRCSSFPDPHRGESWLYRSKLPNYAIGTSMCYWRGTWERNPFPDRSEGCDDLYWRTGDRAKIYSLSPIYERCEAIEVPPDYSTVFKRYTPGPVERESRMIASIHGGNTCAEIKPGVEWTRASEWDEYCRRETAL